jgi:hypothetical protein
MSVPLANLSEEEVLLPPGFQIGSLAPVHSVFGSESSVDMEHEGVMPVSTPGTQSDIMSSCPTNNMPATFPVHLQPLLDQSSEGLSAAEKQQLQELLLEFVDVFVGPDGRLGRTSLVKHEIDTGSAKPIRQAARRLPMAQKGIAETEIQKMLDGGIIEHSASAWSSPVVLVRKKDGSTRFCVDYRRVNMVTQKDAYPLPLIADCLDSLSGAKYFSTLDLASRYWQVEMSEKDKEKTAFSTHQGLYQFRVLPFGLCNAPAIFERLMEMVLRGLQWERCLVYLDDIICFGSDFDGAKENLKMVLQKLKNAGLKLKPKKCNLFQKKVAFLGHVVSQEGVECDPDKIDAVKHWPVPTNVTEVRSFLGLASYYRKFIPKFSHVAGPMTELTKKKRDFVWTDGCQEPFENLKRLLISAPILAYPSADPSHTFTLDTDASDRGVGAVLSQEIEDEEKVIGYASRTLSESQRNYCTTYRELLAVVLFVQHHRHYLWGRHFRIRTDHNSLKWLHGFKNIEVWWVAG